MAWFQGDSDEVSGSPRILADLRGDGRSSRKTVAQTMRKLHLKGVCPKRWRKATLINHETPTRGRGETGLGQGRPEPCWERRATCRPGHKPLST